MNMQRPIKFRAWNKLANGWWYGSLGDVLNLGSLSQAINEKFEFDGDSWFQYTGLKDKNGVEIYQGDVLKNTRGYGAGNKTVVWKVNNNQCGFNLSVNTPQCFEVIGNIYSNPDLLKKETT